ncbi:hypothetical protein E2C01_019087 [Portunus trituberculatus]|uniref:Uncharacterized protein n=1 Tax=Portunus trituberculatus TaxID=210409 RepID=A0A5B7DZ10_PORTR|nr:hypothetical protein [Portunus trituberculatus]
MVQNKAQQLFRDDECALHQCQGIKQLVPLPLPHQLRAGVSPDCNTVFSLEAVFKKQLGHKVNGRCRTSKDTMPSRILMISFNVSIVGRPGDSPPPPSFSLITNYRWVVLIKSIKRAGVTAVSSLKPLLQIKAQVLTKKGSYIPGSCWLMAVSRFDRYTQINLQLYPLHCSTTKNTHKSSHV